MYTTTVLVAFLKRVHLSWRGKVTNMLKSFVAGSARRDGMPLGELSASTNVQRNGTKEVTSTSSRGLTKTPSSTNRKHLLVRYQTNGFPSPRRRRTAK